VLKKIKEAIVVEGRYDKNTLSQVVDALIVETDGFGIFNDKSALKMLRMLADRKGLIVLTDSDSAGFLIRNYLTGAIDKNKLKHAYIPDVYGREKRKSEDSKEQKLGVEGMRPEILLKALLDAGATIDGKSTERAPELTNSDFTELGLVGMPGSLELREKLKKKLDLPEKLSSVGLKRLLGALYTKEELILILENL
jgi:ribonuclease M5